jgi:parvulin-like peptidyl-prolyl isomerase
MKVEFIISSICCLIFLTGCSDAQQEGKVIAEVGSEKLTLEFLLDQFPTEYRDSMTKAQLAKAVDSWIESELLYQEALKHNIDKDKQVKNLIEQKRKEIIVGKFVDISVATDLEVKDEIIDSVYNSQKDRFSVNEDLFDLSHIVLSTRGGAEAVYSRLVKGEDFIGLAEDYSEDPETRQTGGNIGLLSASSLEKNMLDEINKLRVGQYSSPVKSQSGYYHIFLLKDKKAAGETLPLEDIREDIARSIIAEQQQQIYDDLINRLKQSAKIKRYPLDAEK